MNIDQTKQLYVCWSKRERDLMYYFPRSCDGSMLNSYFSHAKLKQTDDSGKEVMASLVEELERRGYDLTTLRFSIKRKV